MTNKADFHLATPAAVDRLVSLMTEFYAESEFELDAERARTAFVDLTSDPGLGRVWVIVADDQDVGYVVLCLGYSMEYGGRDGFVDDLFIRRAWRGQGLGGGALKVLKETAREMGVRALHLEVARDNAPAQALYRKTGFEGNDRQLLTLRLADPTHRE